ncbi:MAG: response regulator [Thermodesulfobacteria bacterium]|nr:response regulator [Thermodesulfobacteriota bacterium]
MAKQTLNVLIVDDEDVLRENLSLLISSLEGCRPFEARNGYEALDLLNKYPIDVVLLDINMPGLGGLEVLKLIRQSHFEIPVILMTSYPSLEITVEALRNGAVDFLIKPFTAKQLEQALKKIRQRKDLPKDSEYQQLLNLLKQKTREQTLLFTVSDRLTSSASLQELYREIINLSREFTASEEVVFYLLDLEHKKLVPEVWEGFSDKPSTIDFFDDNPVSKCLREGLPYLLPSLNGQKALLSAPFSIKNESFGVLVLCRRENYTQDDLFAVNLILERAAPLAENFILYESILLNLHDALRALVKTLEAKDPYTKEHSERVTQIALLIGKEMGLSNDELESLKVAGHLHDIGKVGIKDYILLKPGRLTPEEYEIIKKHPLIGAEIVGYIGLLRQEVEIIKHHHERWDGRGYPDGLAGEDIPLLARVLAVADTYDAMTSVRPYRPPLPREAAVEEILRHAGTQFDPEVAEAFVRVWQEDKSLSGEDYGRSMSQSIA